MDKDKKALKMGKTLGAKYSTWSQADWGYVGQMQCSSDMISVGVCVAAGRNSSLWYNFEFSAPVKLDRAIKALEKKGFHLVG